MTRAGLKSAASTFWDFALPAFSFVFLYGAGGGWRTLALVMAAAVLIFGSLALAAVAAWTALVAAGLILRRWL